jgi:glutaredoxin-related protein
VRPILTAENIHPKALSIVENNHQDIVDEVKSAISANNIVIVGMAQNPAPKRAKKILDDLNIKYCYLEYGSYFKQWRRRNALKMWTGWPTFPMIFVNGTFIGGSSDMRQLIDDDEMSNLSS